MRAFVVSVAILASLPVLGGERRGGIAFHYARPLTPAQLEWFARFEVLVTHDPLPRAQVDALHRRGTKLVLYEWAVAYYASLATPAHRALPVLNRRPLRGHLGSTDADAHYYDPASTEHARGRAELIARRLKSIGYDGVFLDTTTAESVHPEALREYEKRHPDVPYDEAYALFLRNLSRAVELVVTNQGYRRAEHVLPYADWDVSESLITYPKTGKYVLRPWNDANDRWNSIAVLMRELIAPAARKYPRVRFAHINYVDDAKAVDDVVAIARLFNMEAFVARPSLDAALVDDIYFFDFGKAGPRIETRRGARRSFENGFIALDGGTVTVRRER
jgi:hypothetical protein